MEIKFSERLEHLIAERGVNQKWLADEAGTTEATISRYLAFANKSPNVEILASIALALNTTTDYLLGLSDVKNARNDLTAEEQLLVAAFRRASERDKAITWQVFDTYLSQNEKGFLQQSEQALKAE